MKLLSLMFVFLFAINSAFSQQKAVTENGDEVVLYDDGTWEFVNGEVLLETEVPTNPKKFKKDDNSTFLLKSNEMNLGFWIDPKKWSFQKAETNADAEYELQLKEGDLYGMIITEGVQIPLETMRFVALENGKVVAPDIKIVQEEYRNVNGLEVLFLQMDGTMQGLKFSYYGYYFNNESGTVQFITYTAQSLMGKYAKDCELLLNGLVETN